MANIFLIVLAHITVTILVMVIWLARTHLKLKDEIQALKNTVQKNDQEMVGLNAFEMVADRRLVSIDEQLQALSIKISTFQQNEQSANPYNAIIQKIRHGADVEELMRDCNLCQDEAVLLMRLHGSAEG